MVDQVDKVEFGVGADIGPLKAKGAEAEAVFDKIGDKAQAAGKKTGSAFTQAMNDGTEAARRLQASIDRLNDGMAKTPQRALKPAVDDLEALRLKYDSAYAKQQNFAKAQSEISKLVQSGAISTNAGAAALKEFEIGLDHSTGGARRMREGLVLVHEFIRGDFKRGVGSAMIELQNFGLMGAVFSPVGLGIIATTAALGTMVAAALAADEQLSKVKRNIANNGDASGITQSQLVASGAVVGQRAGLSAAGGQNAIMAMNARGNVAASLLPSAALAGSYLANATGGDAKKILEEFEKELADPAKGAKELNEQFKLLSAGQVRQIEDLESSGRIMEAQQIVISATSDRFRDAADSASILSQAFRGTKETLGNFFGWLGHAFDNDKSGTPQERVDRLSKQLKAAQANETDLGSGRITTIQSELAQAKADLAADAKKAAISQAAANEDAILGRVHGLSSKWDVEANKSKERSDAIAQATLGVTAASNRLREDSGKSPGLLAADRENLSEAQAILANAKNPKYKPGSGIPKEHVSAGVNQFAVDAATAQEQLDIARQVAAAPEGQRTMLREQLQAKLQYDKNLLNKKAAPYAKTIYDAKLAEAGINQQTQASDQIANTKEAANANEKLAQAYTLSTKAAKDQEIANAAASAKLKNAAVDVDALTAALHRQSYAEALVAANRGLSSLGTANTAAQAIVAAGGNPAAIARAQRESEAQASTQSLFDSATTPAQLAAANKSKADYVAGYSTRDATRMSANDNSQNYGLEQQIALQQKGLALKYADAELRAKEMADLQAKLDLEREGWSEEQVGYAQALAARQKLLEQQGELGLALSGQTKAAQLTDALRSGLEQVGMAGTKSFKDMKSAAANLLTTIGDLLIKLYVIDPLINGALGKGGGGQAAAKPNYAAQAAATVLDAVFGGGKAGGGPISPGAYYVVGENGPEIMGPGRVGVVSPMATPNLSGMTPGYSQAQAVHYTYAITVAGNGDKELLGRMHAVASSTVHESLVAYSGASQRNLRQSSITAQKRALR